MTTLANFQEIIEPVILKRGRSYFEKGRILELREQETGFWMGKVQGKAEYNVAVRFLEDNNLVWACSCDYDDGPACEHITAVLYALEAGLGKPPVQKPTLRIEQKAKGDNIREALDALSREELLNLLVELAGEDRALAQKILVRHGTKKSNSIDANQKVRTALRTVQDRHGFIDYWGAPEAANKIMDLLYRADRHLDKGHPERALPIYKAVIEELVPAIAHADDSMGVLGDCIDMSFEGLQDAALELPPAERAAMFTYCLTLALDEHFADWDWCWDVAGVAGDLVETAEQRARLFAVLDQMAGRKTEDEWHSEYIWERAAEIKLAVIMEQDGEADVLSFLENNSEHELMRLALARYHLERGHLAEARRICEEWLALPEPKKPNLKIDFMVVLLNIAEAAGDRELQINLVGTLFQMSGSAKFFAHLKELVPPAEWAAFRYSFLNETRSTNRPWIDYGQLYVDEQMWPELLALVQDEPRSAPKHDKYLAERYPQELSAVYERLALATLEKKVNRKGYQEACRHLLQMERLGQGERMKQLVARLREEYKQRPALIDELKKNFA